MSDQRPYYEIPGFEGYQFEDGWVCGVYPSGSGDRHRRARSHPMTSLRQWAIAISVAVIVLVLAFVATAILGFLGFAFLVQSGTP